MIAALLLACQAPCEDEGRCRFEGGSYLVFLPDGWRGGPAHLHVHGWGRTAEELARRDEPFIEDLQAEGRMVVFPEDRDGDWNVARGREDLHDLEVFDALLRDLQERFDADLDQVTASGHSVGASVIWELACYRSDDYAALVAFSGTLWEPVPASCPGPAVPLLHAHGLSDEVFPMEGRSLGGAVQGAILPMWSRATDRAACTGEAPAVPWRSMSCVDHLGCAAPHRFCTWNGEHKLQAGWDQAALEWVVNPSP